MKMKKKKSYLTCLFLRKNSTYVEWLLITLGFACMHKSKKKNNNK